MLGVMNCVNLCEKCGFKIIVSKPLEFKKKVMNIFIQCFDLCDELCRFSQTHCVTDDFFVII